jgi:hypothetical protein
VQYARKDSTITELKQKLEENMDNMATEFLNFFDLAPLTRFSAYFDHGCVSKLPRNGKDALY